MEINWWVKALKKAFFYSIEYCAIFVSIIASDPTRLNDP